MVTFQWLCGMLYCTNSLPSATILARKLGSVRHSFSNTPLVTCSQSLSVYPFEDDHWYLASRWYQQVYTTPPKVSYEFQVTITNNILWKPMQPIDMLHKQFSSL